MDKMMRCAGAVLGVLINLPSMAHEQGTVEPRLLLKEVVQGMPRSERQEVRVLTASFNRLHSGRRVHVGTGGTRAHHGESWPSACGAAECEDDRLQPQCERAVASRYFLYERSGHAVS